jgi:uncharacterized protein (DUF2235 family)
MKRIIVCADGTWNDQDQIDPNTGKRRPTNVTKLTRAIIPRAADGIEQVVYYHDGVGTGDILDRFTGGAFGDGIEINVRDLYRFLVYNFNAGDEIYLFGFSRGAFTVRTLAGFMNRVGLVQKDDDYFVPDLYACYEQSKGPGTPEWDAIFRFIKDPRPCPPIRFIGVWDTVGALGAPGFLGQLLNRNKYQYHDVDLNPWIQNAFHALAIDERRKPFQPNLWSKPAGWSGQLEQAWFAGVHSNVGGGYSPDGLANEALHWMVEKAEHLGLEVDRPYLLYFTPCFNSILQNSMTLMYRLFGPYVRPIGIQPDGFESIHRSALDRRGYPPCDYHPENLAAYLARNSFYRPALTTRVPTGTPCPETPGPSP